MYCTRTEFKTILDMLYVLLWKAGDELKRELLCPGMVVQKQMAEEFVFIPVQRREVFAKLLLEEMKYDIRDHEYYFVLTQREKNDSVRARGYNEYLLTSWIETYRTIVAIVQDGTSRNQYSSWF